MINLIYVTQLINDTRFKGYNFFTANIVDSKIQKIITGIYELLTAQI